MFREIKIHEIGGLFVPYEEVMKSYRDGDVRVIQYWAYGYTSRDTACEAIRTTILEGVTPEGVKVDHTGERID